MSKQVTISGTTYTLPTQGDNPQWGEDLSDVIEALIDVSNSVVADDDILLTSFSIPNVASNVNVTGLVFDISSVRSAIIEYSIYRVTDSVELSESGTLLLTYKSVAASWETAQYAVGTSNTTLSVTSLGQIQILPEVIAGSGYSGIMKFKARTFEQ